MLTFSKQTDYALIILSQLKGREDTFVPLSHLVEHTHLPQRFLARIAAILVARNILMSREGRVGGYKLSTKIDSISVYDFLSIFERHMGFLHCLNKGYSCKYKKICTHRHNVQEKLHSVVVEQLQKTKLHDLL